MPAANVTAVLRLDHTKRLGTNSVPDLTPSLLIFLCPHGKVCFPGMSLNHHRQSRICWFNSASLEGEHIKAGTYRGDAEVGQEWGPSSSEGQAGLDENMPRRAGMAPRSGDPAALDL